MEIPQNVRKVIGKILTEENLVKFWVTKNQLLNDESPEQLWEKGEIERVLNFIEGAKSGDMV